MSNRISRADLARMLETVAELAGATLADDAWPITDPRRDGAWFLSHNSAYGGWDVRCYRPSGENTFTAEGFPLWEDRCSARMMHDRLHAAAHALRYAQGANQ